MLLALEICACFSAGGVKGKTGFTGEIILFVKEPNRG